MVGGVPFFSPSSRARSAGWTVCAAVHGSGGRFSCPRMAGTATRAPDAANRIATAETKKTAWRRFVSGAKELLKRRSILGRVDLWIQRNCRLFLEVGPRALEFHGCGGESLRTVLVGGERPGRARVDRSDGPGREVHGADYVDRESAKWNARERLPVAEIRLPSRAPPLAAGCPASTGGEQ